MYMYTPPIYRAFLESEGGVGLVGTRILWLAAEGETVVNINAANGRARCRVTDSHNVPLQGYDWDQAVPFSGDSLRWRPQWRNSTGSEHYQTMSSLGGKGVHSVIHLESKCFISIAILTI